ncbi:hypothetical protein [Haloarcula sp. Atlit-120R]|uniref:hypothetical protein n=1 Tax=Haloarcula sp. Atlit-120R TaxID=2282135 RepID=UPI0011C3AB9B|nr:hypothetical protein [Haloarcula sp. Atlit-120R]
MPTVEKTEGGRVTVRGIGEFGLGDQAEVSEDDAAYLCDERGDFERIDDVAAEDETGGDDVHQEDGPPDPDDLEDDAESGTLPFNPADLTNDEVADRAADIDDPATLRALLNLEEEQKDRSGATDAIEERLGELEG